jgi:hypothetical protein
MAIFRQLRILHVRYGKTETALLTAFPPEAPVILAV